MTSLPMANFTARNLKVSTLIDVYFDLQNRANSSSYELGDQKTMTKSMSFIVWSQTRALAQALETARFIDSSAFASKQNDCGLIQEGET